MSDPQKPRPSVLPKRALYATCRVIHAGNRRPGRAPGDWLERDPVDFADAAVRHLLEHLDGELVDEETGELHLAHAVASALMALELVLDGSSP